MQPEDLQALRRDARAGAVVLVDVREPYEWDAGHIDGAVHIPMGVLADRQGDLDEEATVVFICRVGGRSAQATEYFRRAGYDAENLDGGVLAWTSAGLPLVTESGTPGTVAPH